MAKIPLVIEKVERKSLLFAKVFVSKKTYSFDWDKNSPDEDQYSNILKLTVSYLREESADHEIKALDSMLMLPESFDKQGAIFTLSVERRK